MPINLKVQEEGHDQYVNLCSSIKDCDQDTFDLQFQRHRNT